MLYESKASKFLFGSASQSWRNDWISTSLSENNYDNLTIEVQIPKIIDTVLNPLRFDRVTTIIVDYKMPGLDGLKFLEKMAEISAKRILLTNVADTHIAIDAIENGLIDSYIKKHDSNMLKKLKYNIDKHRLAFFREKSAFIWHSLSIFSGESEKNQRSYCDLIESIHRQYRVTEYYLIDQNGSYRFFNDDGEQIDLIIKTKEQLEADLDTFQEKIDDSSSFEELKKFEAMLSPISRNAHKPLTATPLNNDHTIFFALEKGEFNAANCQM